MKERSILCNVCGHSSRAEKKKKNGTAAAFGACFFLFSLRLWLPSRDDYLSKNKAGVVAWDMAKLHIHTSRCFAGLPNVATTRLLSLLGFPFLSSPQKIKKNSITSPTYSTPTSTIATTRCSRALSHIFFSILDQRCCSSQYCLSSTLSRKEGGPRCCLYRFFACEYFAAAHQRAFFFWRSTT